MNLDLGPAADLENKPKGGLNVGWHVEGLNSFFMRHFTAKQSRPESSVKKQLHGHLEFEETFQLYDQIQAVSKQVTNTGNMTVWFKFGYHF